MRDNFRKALNFVLEHECVFARRHEGDYDYVICEHVPGDHGGLTKFGIDQASHPDVNIRALDYEAAARIYNLDYWTRCRCDDLPEGVDLAVFDTAVNCGTGTSIRLLQRALNRGGAEPPVKEDGYIGPRTMRAVAQSDTQRLIQMFTALREDRYHTIAANDESQRVFLRGWLRRVDDLNAAVGVQAS